MQPFTAAEALQHLLDSAQLLTGTETIPLALGSERILARPILAGEDVPPQDNSAMDGYALRAADHHRAGTQWFTISQRIAAGAPPQPLTPGTVARLFTGAEIPAGADTVVLQEDCQQDGDRVSVPADLQAGAHIRPRGQDIERGSEVVRAGELLTPARLGLLASVGIASIEVRRKLRVAILSTGDELVEPGQPRPAGKIYNSNRYQLTALLQKMNIDVVDMGMVRDLAENTLEALSEAATSADVVISTAGVSVGEEDHVRAAIEELGHLSLWKLAVKPGKPLAFGRIGDTPFIGLPGNPLSTFITFLFFARPYLQRCQGREPLLPQGFAMSAGFQRRAASRQQYLLVRASAGEPLQLFPNQSSGMLSSAAWANAVAIVPPDSAVAPGDQLQTVFLQQLF